MIDLMLSNDETDSQQDCFHKKVAQLATDDLPITDPRLRDLSRWVAIHFKL